MSEPPLFRRIILSEEELEHTPSRASGISESDERLLRAYGCSVISDLGFLLKLTQSAIATAQYYFHYFFFATSFLDQNIENICLGCILLASKLAEETKFDKYVASVFCCVKYRRLCKELLQSQENSLHYFESVLQESEVSHLKDIAKNELDIVVKIHSMFYSDIRTAAKAAEIQIVASLGFNFFMELPHKFLLNYLNILSLSVNKELAQLAWNYTNDTLRTPVCFQVKPETLATASIYLACHNLGIPMHEEPTPWWYLFDSTLEDIHKVCWNLQKLYEMDIPLSISTPVSTTFPNKLAHPADRLCDWILNMSDSSNIMDITLPNIKQNLPKKSHSYQR